MTLCVEQREAYWLFYGWLVLVGLMLFGGFLAWQYGWMQALVETDTTRLSLVILLLFVFASAYLGICSWRLSLDWSALQRLRDDALAAADDGIVAEHLRLMAQARGDVAYSEALMARLVEQVHGRHGNGWFLSDLLIRLGLLGTVIGFILMLGPIAGLQEQNIEVLKELLGEMSGGMQVALFTTLTGLGCGMLLALQCQWLDRSADRLVSALTALATRRLAVGAAGV